MSTLPEHALASAFDGDVFAAPAGAAACFDVAAGGELVGIDSAERCSLGVFARLAIGACRGPAAVRAAREAMVDAIVIAMVFDDKDPGLGAGCNRSGKRQDHCDEDGHVRGRIA